MLRILKLLLVLAIAIPVVGQEYIFNRLTVNDGLASNLIHSVYQDKVGYIWIGTENGLQRYDGHRFTNCSKRAENELLSHPINQVIGGNDGKIWLRIKTSIGYLDPTTFKFTIVPVRKKESFTSGEYILQKTSKGDIFVVIRQNGWLFYNQKKQLFDEETAPFIIPFEFGCYVVHEDVSTGNYWVGGKEGLGFYHTKTKQFYTKINHPERHPLLQEKRLYKSVTNFFIDKSNRIWIVNWDLGEGRSNGQQFFCFDDNKKTFLSDTTGLGQMHKNGYFEVHGFKELSDKMIMIHGNKNFAFIHNGSNHFESVSFSKTSMYGIRFNFVNDILQDQEKLLWVATDNGLYTTWIKTKESRYTEIDSDTEDGNFNAIFQRNENEYWVGTWGDGIKVYNQKLIRQPTPDYLKLDDSKTSYSLVWDIMKHSSSNDIWIGCQDGRLQIANPTTRKSRFLNPAVLENKTIRQIKEDKQGNIWIGTQKGHIVKWQKGRGYDDSNFKLVFKIGYTINRIYIDSHGLVWIGTEGNGIYILNPTNNKLINHIVQKNNKNLPDNNISDVIQYDEDQYFFASSVLVSYDYETQEIKTFEKNKENTPHRIITMQIDQHKQLWLSSMGGIYKFNPQNSIFTYYNQWDGLISATNRSFVLEQSLRLSNNHFLFSGNSCLLSFDPSQYKTNKALPPVQLTDVKVFNQHLSIDSILKNGELRLPYSQNSITIDFSSLSYTRLHKLAYYYQLEGVEKEWTLSEGALQINYSLLPPGTYKLKLKCQNEEGVFSKITELPIIITPPFWKTEWFIALMILLLIGVLYGLHQLRVNRLLYIEKVRSRLSRDLHDDMGSTLSTINILSNMAVKRIDTGQEISKDYLIKISNNSSRIMEALDDIVWSINPSNDDMNKVISRMKELTGNILEAKEIEYNFKIEDRVKEISLDMEKRRNLFLIFKEALNNIVKYANCTKVEIEMVISAKTLLMSIKDNGEGFELDNIVFLKSERGNGIPNMYKRAEEIQSELDIQSTYQKGTTIALQVPIT